MLPEGKVLLVYLGGLITDERFDFFYSEGICRYFRGSGPYNILIQVCLVVYQINWHCMNYLMTRSAINVEAVVRTVVGRWYFA